MRGRGLLCEKPPPSRSLPKRLRGGDAGGRGRFSERSASPPRPLSPEERLAFGGVRFLLLGSACRVGAFASSLCEFTAADSAAADMRLWGWHIESSQWPETIGCFLMLAIGCRNTFVPPRWQGAAALSAAVTTTKHTGDRPPSQAEPTPKSQPT